MPAGTVRHRVGAPLGVWLLASALLGAPQDVAAPYPHIHGQRIGDRWWLGRRECAACVLAVARGDPGGAGGDG